MYGETRQNPALSTLLIGALIIGGALYFMSQGAEPTPDPTKDPLDPALKAKIQGWLDAHPHGQALGLAKAYWVTTTTTITTELGEKVELIAGKDRAVSLKSPGGETLVLIAKADGKIIFWKN